MYEGLNALKFLPVSQSLNVFFLFLESKDATDGFTQPDVISPHPSSLFFFVQYFHPSNLLMLFIYFFFLFIFSYIIARRFTVPWFPFHSNKMRALFGVRLSPRSVRNSRGWLKEEMMKGNKEREKENSFRFTERERLANTK